jgi:murein L,D-transpeptidase YcbB/YkuD
VLVGLLAATVSIPGWGDVPKGRVGAATSGPSPAGQTPAALVQQPLPGAPADCANSVVPGAMAKLTAPPDHKQPPTESGARLSKRGGGKAQAKDDIGGAALSDDPSPTVAPETLNCTKAAAQRYADIANHGGWPPLAKPLKQSANPGDLAILRERLGIEADLGPLPNETARRARWDDALTKALKHYQARLGLRQTGILDATTLRALNVSAADRARELQQSAQRLAAAQTLPFDKRFVLVNIPGAAVEAVEGGRVVHRYTAVVGGSDHQSPQIVAKITDIVMNPSWTLPASIIKNEIIPKMVKNPRYLSRMNIRILDGRGREVNPRRIDWSSNEATEYTLRQDAGRKNSLGTLKINMPNKEALYMHDTPAKSSFAQDYRFLSHGCVRVDGVYDLAMWLLDGVKGPEGDPWDVTAIKDAVKGDDTQTIKLKQAVPVAWIYLDGWESSDGTVHFREDIYGLDHPPAGGPVSLAK